MFNNPALKTFQILLDLIVLAFCPFVVIVCGEKAFLCQRLSCDPAKQIVVSTVRIASQPTTVPITKKINDNKKRKINRQ